MGHSQLQYSVHHFLRMNSRVEIDFKIFNNQCEVKSVLKLVYMIYSIITCN